MPIATCPHCSNQAQVSEDFLTGQWVACPHCQKTFGVGGRVPTPPHAEPSSNLFDDEPIQVERQYRPRKQKSSGILWKIIVGFALVVLCSGIVIWQQAKTDEELSKADAEWDAGKRGEAVAKYKELFTKVGQRKGKLLQRIVEYEVSKGNNKEAKTWVEKGLDGKISVAYETPAAKGLLAQIQNDRENARKQRAEAERKRKAEADADAARKAEEEYNANGLVLLKKTVSGKQTQIGIEITGTVVNRRARQLNYAQIQFNLYDASGAQVGSALANINGLEPGGRWNFKAVGFTKNSITYKFSQLSGF